MKVIHISGYCHAESVGGTERYVLDLIRGLETHGIESCIGWVTGAPRAPFESAGVAIYPLPAAAMRVDAPAAGLGLQAAELLDRLKPKLLHFHTFGLTEAEIARIARAKNIPYFFTYHSPGWMCRRQDLMIWNGTEPCDGEVRTWRCSACKIQEHFGGPSWTGYVGAAMSWPLDLIARGSNSMNFRRRVCFLSDTRRFRRALREFLHHSEHVMSCSEWGRPKLVANGASSSQVSVVPQGVSEEFLLTSRRAAREMPARRSRKTMTIGYVGRVVPVKGVDILARGFTQVAGEDLRLKIFGWEGEHAVGAFTRSLAELGRRDGRIELYPKLQLEAMAATYREIDLLAIPSVWPETGPLVLFEALQMGVPVFGSNRLGHPALLQYGGAMIEPNTPGSWRLALENAANKFRCGQWQHHLDQVQGMPEIRSMRDVAGEVLALYQTVAADGALALA